MAFIWREVLLVDAFDKMHLTLTLGFLCVLISIGCYALPSVVPIGAIFSPNDLEERLVFYAAIDQINHIHRNVTFKPHVTLVDQFNSYDAYNQACTLLHSGPVAIFGPHDASTAMQVQSVCEHFEVPHIENRLIYDFRHRTDLSVNLHPHQAILSQVYQDLIDAWGWKSFVVIYEESEKIIHFNEFLERSHLKGWDIKIFQLQPDRPYRDVLWEVKESGETNILLDVSSKNIPEVFRQALQVGIMSEKHCYLVTSLDLHTLELENYRHSKTNITSLRIVKEDHPLLRALLDEWSSYSANYMPHDNVPLPRYLKSSSAMIYDGISIFHKGLLELNKFNVHPIDCHNGDPWQYGASLINYIRQVATDGITGWLGFDDSGFRANLTFEIISITESEFDVIGHWFNGIITKNKKKWNRHLGLREEVHVIRVTTKFNDPFLMRANSSTELKGNDRYEGYVVDLLNEISKLINLKFEINLVKDNQYGNEINSTFWDGMVGEVMRNEADIAIVDLTINSAREKAVDFTYPFMSTGIKIIFKKPTTRETSLWSFLSPFSTVVWIYLLGAFVGISLIFFYIGRFTPYEWSNPNPCRHHDPVLENACNARNSFWCNIGSLMQQGSDVAPKALSTRAISAIWYFFTLIIVSSYTANLAAFLTVEKDRFPFDNVEQLANQTKIKYGCLKNGATHKFFKASKIETYKRMAQFMENNPDVFVNDNKLGPAKVQKENGMYAFFMESAQIEYIVERFCDLAEIGNPLDSKGYGVATRKGSKIRAPMSEAILKLQETGVLQQLKDRWWKQKGGGQCLPAQQQIKLGLRNLGGVFVVLVVGSLFSLLVGIGEFLIKTRMSTTDSSTYYQDLWHEIKFVFSCYKSTKVLKRKSMKSLSGSRRSLFDTNQRVMSPSGDSLPLSNTIKSPPTSPSINRSENTQYL